MKKIVPVAVFAVLVSTGSYAQLAVFDAAVQTILEATQIEQFIHYAQMLQQTIENVQNTYQQVQAMVRAEQRALENLRSISEVTSFDDFMQWQNRQLYMEREVEDRFNNMGIKIGKDTYHMSEIQEIPDAAKKTYVDYWDGEFTEEQREEMYTTLGLSPGNYVYTKTWRDREDQIARTILNRAQVLNDENSANAERQYEIARRYRTADESLTEKKILMEMHETLMGLDRAVRNLSQQQAERDAYDQALYMQAQTPPNPPRLSSGWNRDDFGSITSEDTTYSISDD
ncbi:MAG: hypothetical protein LBP76_07630 [Treponema sp.]|jgi:hypothetical protein|nr:hypothetical protein [Treponema sp.]